MSVGRGTRNSWFRRSLRFEVADEYSQIADVGPSTTAGHRVTPPRRYDAAKFGPETPRTGHIAGGA